MSFFKDDDRDPDGIDRIADEIRNETIDAGRIEEATNRVWDRLMRSETDPVAASATAAAAQAPSADRPDSMIEGCPGYRSLIPSYVAGRLSRSRALLLEDHTSECAACRHALAIARTGDPAQSAAGSNVTPFTGAAAMSEAPPQRGHRWAWTLAAAACLTALVAGLAALRVYRPFAATDEARVRSVNGIIYRVSDAGTVPVAERAVIRYGDSIRTAKGSDAVVELADGSLVEMNERSEMRVSAGMGDTRIDLPRGEIIVQAAKRSSGHLFVQSGETLVSVTGTIFEVEHGTKGSRVSVIEGEVHVDHDGAKNVLHPGQQVATHASMSPTPVAREIAWSRDVDRYLAVMKEMTDVRSALNEVHSPALRYRSRLLDRVPAGTFMYVAIPNITGTLDEAQRRIQQRIQQSEVLKDWFARESAGKVSDQAIERILADVRRFGDQLGDEIVVAVQTPARGNGVPGDDGPFVVLSELKSGAASRPFFEQEIARLNAEASRSGGRSAAGGNSPSPRHGGAPVMRMLPESLDDVSDQTTAARSAGGLGRLAKDGASASDPSDVFLWIHDDTLVIAPSVDMVRRVAAIDAEAPAGANPFVQSPFHDTIAQSYSEGAGWIFAVDMKALVARMMQDGGDARQSRSVLQQSGFLDAQQFIVEVKEVGNHTQTRGVLTFDQPRHGLASWLAAPAPMGALGFVSPDSTLAAAFVVKEPALMVDDLFGIVGTANAQFNDRLSEFESKSGISIRQDLASSLGGEFVVAMDGPVLPVPAWKAVFEVYDPARLQTTIEHLVTAINAEHAASSTTQTDPAAPPLAVSQETSGGRTFYTISGGNGQLAVHYVFVDGYLIVAPQKALLDRAIQNRDTGYVLAGSPTFRDLLPEDGQTNFSALVYQNLGSVIGPVAQQMAGSSALSSDQQSTLQQIAAQTPATLSYAYGESDRITFAMTGQGTIASSLGGLFGFGDRNGVASMFASALEAHEEAERAK